MVTCVESKTVDLKDSESPTAVTGDRYEEGKGKRAHQMPQLNRNKSWKPAPAEPLPTIMRYKNSKKRQSVYYKQKVKVEGNE